MSEAPFQIQSRDGAVSFEIIVAPRASRARIGPLVGGRLKVSVTAPPVEGKANAAVIAELARALDVPKRAIEIVAGGRGKRKTVRVEGATRDQVIMLVEGE